MSDAWAEIQALKTKRDHRRKRLEERKKERQLGLSSTSALILSSVVSGLSVFFHLNYSTLKRYAWRL